MTRHAAPAAADSGDAQAPPGALVVGGAHVSIAVARSLGRRGIPVWLLASHPLPRFSRYVQRSFPGPAPSIVTGLRRLSTSRRGTA